MQQSKLFSVRSIHVEKKKIAFMSKCQEHALKKFLLIKIMLIMFAAMLFLKFLFLFCISDQLSASEDMSSNGAANMGSGGGGTDAVTGGTGGDDGVDDASVDEIRDNSAGVTDNNDVAGDNSDQTEEGIHVTGEDSGTDAVGVANGSVNESGNNGAGSMVNNNVAGVNSDEADVVIDDGDNGDGSGALDTESDDDVVRINDADVVGHDDGPSNNADTGNDLSGDSVDANDSFGAGGSAGANDGDMHALDSGSDEDDIHVVQVKKVENNSTG